MNGHSMARKPNEQERVFLSQVQRAWKCGIDSHLELMTHHGLFDFQIDREPEGVVHEGLWLYEPAITEISNELQPRQNGLFLTHSYDPDLSLTSDPG